MKLGIIADPASANSAALLTAELSKVPDQYELLERDAVDHVLQEQGIARSGATAGDWAKVGHLLAADGLVLLQKRKTGESETTNIGWVLSVNSGVVLGAEVLPSDEKTQAKVLAELLQRCALKMGVKMGDAVPVSVVPAEAADARFGDGTREIFQNGLMLHLMRDPSVFVQQREQLDTILFERDFAGAEKQGFWAGANIVQCRVGPDPLKKEVLVAALSLKRRDGSSESWVEKANSPQELCASAATSIRDRLKLSSSVPEYDAKKEIAYFRQKLTRLLYRNYGPSTTDTAVTLQALGDQSPVTEQIAAMAPVAKVCGTFFPNAAWGKYRKGTLTDRKAALVAMRQTIELESNRVRKVTVAFPNRLDQRSVTEHPLLYEELDLASTILLMGMDPEDPALKPDMSALRRQVVDYLKLATDAKWYSPAAFFLTHGEYFFDDPNAWLDSVESIFRPPFRENPLVYASLWIWYTNLQIPRRQYQTLYTPNFYDEYAQEDPKTVAAVLPRLKQWAYGKEPGLRIAAACVLCREREAKEAKVDRTEMARILVKAMDEVMPQYLKGPQEPFGPFERTNGGGGRIFTIRRWLKNVQPLAHKELLDLSIRTLDLADNTNAICLFTPPANQDEAAALGRALRAAEKRLGISIRNGDFDEPRRMYPEAFADPAPAGGQPVQEKPVQEKVARLIWNSQTAIPKSGAISALGAGPSECGGKLWFILQCSDAAGRAQLSLVGSDLVTGAQTMSEIPLPHRERFEWATAYGNMSISTPQHLVMNERWLVAGPLDLWKNNTKTNEEQVWLILDRQKGTWKDLVVPLGKSFSHHLPPLLLGDRAYWPFSINHPEQAAGIMEINCAAPGWNFHPCERLAKENFSAPYLVWNRDRNTMILMSGAKVVPEFDLKSSQWLEERPTSAGEALLLGTGLKTARDIPMVDYGEDTGNEFEVKSDTAKGIWNVNAVDPQTRRAEHFTLAFDFKGAPLVATEKEAIHPTDAVGNAVLGGRGRSGLWFKLGVEHRLTGPFKLFWLPWAEVHRGKASVGLADVVFVKNREFFAMESGNPTNISLQLGTCHEILDRNARAGTVLVKSIRPTAFLWGRREASGVFTWRVPPVQQPAWIRPDILSSFAVLSPDGMGVRYIASNKQEIREWRAENGQDKAIFTAAEGEELRNFAYTGDDATFAWAGKGKICLQGPSGPLPAFQLGLEERIPMTWSPDGKRLLASNGGTVKLLERTEQGFNEIRQWKGDCCMWTPAGTRVVFAARIRVPWGFTPYALQTIDLSDGSIKPLAPQFYSEMFTLSADGQTVWATGCMQAEKRRKCLLKISVADGSFTEVLGDGDLSQVADLPVMKSPGK